MAKYDKADLERRMKGAVESLRSDLGGLRTGRASVHLLDTIHVMAYGASTPLNQVASKVAPALATGCTVVLKPSEIAPLSAIIAICARLITR